MFACATSETSEVGCAHRTPGADSLCVWLLFSTKYGNLESGLRTYTHNYSDYHASFSVDSNPFIPSEWTAYDLVCTST